MKNIKALLIITVIVFMSGITGCSNNPVPEKVSEKSKMNWWNEARFGMFIHWGLYSIPAGEWNGDTGHAEWIRTTAQIPLEVYDTLINYFNPVNFNPDEWVKTAKEAGMKYIVITSKHHDGFCLFDSEYTDFDVMSTPLKRDILAELSEACHKQGIVMCFYHSIMDWHHPDYLPRRDWEKTRPTEGADMDRYIAYLRNQLKELTTKYGAIGVLWFDGEWEETWTHERGAALYDYVAGLQPGIIINNRVDKGRSGMQGMTTSSEFRGDFGTPEQEVPATGFPGVYWESCITLNDHWGYNKADKNWKSAESVIRMLADISSKGGNLLLNVGPKADGTFPTESTDILSEVGKWMSKNSEAIYGTSASPFERLQWGRCTAKPDGKNTNLYLHVFDWPEDGKLVVAGLMNKVREVYLPDGKVKLDFSVESPDVIIDVPEKAPDTRNTIIVISVKGDPVVVNPPAIKPVLTDFVSEMTISIANVPEGVKAYFTTDGSEPTVNTYEYQAPFKITESSDVRVAFFKEGKRVSDVSRKAFQKVLPAPGQDVPLTGKGLTYKYYEGDFDMLPDFGRLKPLRQGVTAGLDLGVKSQPDFFAIVWKGYLNIEEDAVYLMSLSSDDGSSLFIDGKNVIDNDGLHGTVIKSTSLALGKGLHSIEIRFFQKNGGLDLGLKIEGPDGEVPLAKALVY